MSTNKTHDPAARKSDEHLPKSPNPGPVGKNKHQYLQQSREMIRATLERYLKMLTQIR